MTLIETLITVGILSTVATIGFGSGLDGYENELARANRTSALWSVLNARAEAMNGICAGSDCSAGSSHNAEVANGREVVFSALSGLVMNPEDISIGTGSSTSIVSINEEGQVLLMVQ